MLNVGGGLLCIDALTDIVDASSISKHLITIDQKLYSSYLQMLLINWAFPVVSEQTEEVKMSALPNLCYNTH